MPQHLRSLSLSALSFLSAGGGGEAGAAMSGAMRVTRAHHAPPRAPGPAPRTPPLAGRRRNGAEGHGNYTPATAYYENNELVYSFGTRNRRCRSRIQLHRSLTSTGDVR